MEGYIHSTESYGTVDWAGHTVCHLFSGLSDAMSILPQSGHLDVQHQ